VIGCPRSPPLFRQAHRPYVHSPAGRCAPGLVCDSGVPISWLLVLNGFGIDFAHTAQDHVLGPLFKSVEGHRFTFLNAL
jgi:hypothetical protein